MQIQQHDDDADTNLTTSQHFEVEQKIESSGLKWGNCIVCCIRNGNALIVIGPHWPLFICCMTCFMIISFFLMLWHLKSENMIKKWGTFILCGNQCLSYMILGLTNPGIANKQDHQIEGQRWYCQKCKVIQQMTTVHCYDCDVCIQELDHHCPWTGKCIGRRNLRVFQYFLLSTMAFLVGNLLITITQIDVS